MAEIATDIGHATGTGARGCGCEEHALVEPIALHLRNLLQGEHRVAVIDFAGRDNATDLKLTIKAANAHPFDFGISLHCDWDDSEFSRGAHVCYRSSKGKRLAQCISKPLGKLMPGRADKIVLRKNLAVLNQTNAVWVVVECGFITSPMDVVKLRDNPKAIARAIAEGVEEYIKKYLK